MSQKPQNITTSKMPRRKVTLTKNDKIIDLQKYHWTKQPRTGTKQWKNTLSIHCTRVTRGKILQWSNRTKHKHFKLWNEKCNNFYIYDANCVKGIPIKICTEDEFLQTYKETYATLTNKVYRSKFHKIDNECSKAI